MSPPSATPPVAVPLPATRTLAAQAPAESGIARDARSGAPLRCLHVALVDSSDRAVAHAVTDSAGTLVIVAPSAGGFPGRVPSFRFGARPPAPGEPPRG